jgi:hypothetical protein
MLTFDPETRLSGDETAAVSGLAEVFETAPDEALDPELVAGIV